MREAVAAIIVNTAVWLLRLVFGILTNSLTLIAEAWHSFSDNVTSLIVYVGGRMGSKPPDREHPYGHGRVADLATVLMGSALIVIAGSILYESVQRFLSGYSVAFEYLGAALVVVVLTGAVKELLARYALRLYRLSGSALCLADAWHHRVDALMSFAVLFSFAGFVLAGTNLFDLAGASAISALLAYEGSRIFFESAKVIVDTIPKNLEPRIREAAHRVPEVMDVHDIRVRSYGGKLYVDMKIHVEPGIDVERAHDVAHRVEKEVKASLKDVEEVLVHVEPSTEHGN